MSHGRIDVGGSQRTIKMGIEQRAAENRKLRLASPHVYIIQKKKIRSNLVIMI